ncbi:MAG: hypothetical protein N3E40_05935 [Dehalococcoidia bacterium]|nr:hypothetical protein [Dehalococcoidia bacterium]
MKDSGAFPKRRVWGKAPFLRGDDGPRSGTSWHRLVCGSPPRKETSPIEQFWDSRSWGATDIIAFILGLIAVLSCIFVVYRGYFGNIDTRIERSVIVSLLELYVFLKIPFRRKWNDRLNGFFAFDLVLCLLVVATQVYTVYGAITLATQNWRFTAFGSELRTDHVVGVIVLFLLFEATRRSFGWLMVVLPLGLHLLFSFRGLHARASQSDYRVLGPHERDTLRVKRGGLWDRYRSLTVNDIPLHTLWSLCG